ncbi:sodium-independent anion transporter [Sporanaerobium hydrogeniformans]|uniref:Sodium-independent anion transporter n=1 Tax=Sporanaerobium hydrogeniformans TaxID=3072179 RepID=A0AC61DE11_9FIRM|nr:SulP family inorganic anion transporter [Sporanaerobium hydrogeniformans]PHV71424.1 sodium-independent anion transporter [Sporanaerobium hydrogeniformans]
MVKQFVLDLKQEFGRYNAKRLSKDILAGLTVAAVALPLALAFGVSSGADAAAGLITAILAGFIISALSGASYQISGPTGAMTAILIGLVQKYEMQGVFVVTLLAGIMLLLASFFKFGKIVSFIPAPVITGFTSGIAIIIALGQLDNFFGVQSQGGDAISKFFSYFNGNFSPNRYAILLGGSVILTMLIWPKKWGTKIPSSLVGISVATGISALAKWDVAIVGAIPKTLVAGTRLHLNTIHWGQINDLILPAISVAALGLIESLLCGAAAGRMKGEKLNADRELFAQGIGNILIPFFGGVPATAAIARTSVAIKSGLETRLTGIFHAVGLVLSMFLLGPLMSQIPLSALAGVLIVTAWRMNEWESIAFIFNKKFKTAIAQFLITMIATVCFDLTIAIVIGVVFSVLIFMVKISNIEICASEIKNDKLKEQGLVLQDYHEKAKVLYLTGPIFFTTTEKISEQILGLNELGILIFSMRGVPLIDTTGVQFLEEMCDSLKQQGTHVMFAGVQPKVHHMMKRSGFEERLGRKQFFWSVQDALMALEKKFEPIDKCS